MIKVPRTCVVCRKIGEKDLLLRVVNKDGLIFDFAQVLTGRGMYVHCSEDCLVEKRFFNCISKIKKRRANSGVAQKIEKKSSNIDVGIDEDSQKFSQVSLKSMIEKGKECLELLDVNGNNKKKVLLAKKLFERTKEITLESSKSKGTRSIVKKPPLRL